MYIQGTLKSKISSLCVCVCVKERERERAIEGEQILTSQDVRVNSIIGASLSEPHIDELNVCNLYIMYIYIYFLVRPSPARRYI